MTDELLSQAFFQDFSAQTDQLCMKLRAFLDRLPPLLRDAAVRYARALGLTDESLVWPDIYFLFPLWVQSDLGLAVGPDCLEIAYANACLSYTVLIQDELMDEAVADRGPSLMAANAFSLEGYMSYASLFPAGSSFWRRAGELLYSSWNDLLLEKAMHQIPDEETRQRDSRVQQSKINPGKVAALAIVLRGQREETLPQLFRYLDEWQLGCQMVDDFRDYRSDLRNGNYTRFLVLAGLKENDEAQEERLDEFFGSGALIGYFEDALEHYRKALSACPDKSGYLSRYIQSLYRHLERLFEGYSAYYDLRGAVKL